MSIQTHITADLVERLRCREPMHRADGELVNGACIADIDAVDAAIVALEGREAAPDGFDLVEFNYIAEMLGDMGRVHAGNIVTSAAILISDQRNANIALRAALHRIDGEAPADEPLAVPTVGFQPSRDPEQDDGNDTVREAFEEGVTRGLWLAASIARGAITMNAATPFNAEHTPGLVQFVRQAAVLVNRGDLTGETDEAVRLLGKADELCEQIGGVK